jgi:type I restriction-modification system DNA methylase subunit
MDGNFNSFLLDRKNACRLDFLEAKKQLESFEQESGSLAYYGACEREAQRLSDLAHQAYLAYKKAWTEWYAAINGYSLHIPRYQKDTPAFAAPAPEVWRDIAEHVRAYQEG